MAYSLNFTKQALKELERVPEPFYTKIKSAIKGLTINPRPHGCKKLKGRGSYRIREGDYRIIYDIYDNKLTVDVIKVGNRRDVYD